MATLVVGLLVDAAHLLDHPGLLDWLVAAALGAAMALLGISQTFHVRETRRAERAAEHDKVTGLGNGKRVIKDLERALAGGDRLVMMLFDLEGFKKYNDSYGYACGDALLHRLGRKLTAATAPLGTVYRMRGDEFCVLARVAPDALEPLRDACVAALLEVGEGFMIRCSYGHVVVPDEAQDVTTALKVADQRVHAQREDPRSHAASDMHAALAAVIEDRPQQLEQSPHEVAELTVAVGRRLGLSAATLDELQCAAELRDVGNMAIPDAILFSPGKLGDDEWRFIKAHTLVGERLLKSTFGMHEVARIVRSSHERWDGGGYPDALVGRDIPLGARIVFACSAFSDMTSERPHRPALATGEALAEMRASAGRQFDPHVVELLCHELESPVARPARKPAGAQLVEAA